MVIQKLQSGVLFNQIFNIDEHVKNIEEGVSSSLRLI